MSRFRSSGSYGHAVKQFAVDWYRVFWTVDRYYAGSRLRFPTHYSRDTDDVGARRFAKKWGIATNETPSNDDGTQPARAQVVA